MKIAFMIRNMDERGGINVYTLNLIENILMLDNETKFLLVYNHQKFLGHFSKYENVREIAMRSPSKLVWDQILIPYILWKKKVDVVFNPKLSIPILSNAKKVLMIHGAEQFAVKKAFKWYDRLYYQIAMPLYGRFSDKILTTTKLGINDLSRYIGIVKSKFTFVHEGVHKRFKILDQEKNEAVKIKYDLPDRFILFVGGLTPLKNFGRAAKAFDILSEKYGHSMVVTGFKKFKFKSDMLIAQNVKNVERIKFCGFIPDEDLPAFYNLADVFVFPSLYEGFGLPVLEAMACGCPVVTSSVGCTKEVTGNAALLVNPYDEKDIAEKIQKILDDSAFKDVLVNKGLIRVKQFSWEKCAKETLNVLNSLY